MVTANAPMIRQIKIIRERCIEGCRGEPVDLVEKKE